MGGTKVGGNQGKRDHQLKVRSIVITPNLAKNSMVCMYTLQGQKASVSTVNVHKCQICNSGILYVENRPFQPVWAQGKKKELSLLEQN